MVNQRRLWMKRAFFLSILLFFSFGFSLASDIPKKYKRWVNDEVRYIITKEERKAFLALKTDAEREAFIRDFWKRRDPTPKTEWNEYKEEYYRRLEYVNRYFREEGKKGWLTDRGKVYIIYGPPDNIYEEGVGTPNHRIIWTYNNLNSSTFKGTYQLVFTRNELGNYVLLTQGLPLTPEAAFANLARISFISDVTKSPVESKKIPLKKPPREVVPAAEEKLLKLLLTKGNIPNSLGFRVWLYCFPGSDGASYLPIAFSIESKKLTLSRGGKNKLSSRLSLFGMVLSPDLKKVFHSFLIPFEVHLNKKELDSNREFILFTGFPLKPGNYTLAFGLREVSSGHSAGFRIPLLVPDFSSPTLWTSSLLLAREVVREKEPRPVVNYLYRKMIIGPLAISLDPRARFIEGKDEKFLLFYHIYGYGVDEKGKPSFTITYSISRGGKLVRLFPPADIAFDTVLQPIPIDGLGEGDYTLNVAISDNIRKHTAKRSVSFHIIK